MENKKNFKILVIIISIIFLVLLALLINFIPTFNLKTNAMNEIRGEYITVYYEKEEEAAKDVFQLANSESERIARTLGFESTKNINMFIYDRQNTFKIKKYGLIARFLNLDWYIGDNRDTNVLLTSPANPGASHNYNSVKYASIHEMVHAYNSILNSKMPLWINEGLALYLSNQNPDKSLYNNRVIPSIEQTHTSNPIEFSNMDGYQFAYTYIEYLHKSFGWENVLTFVKIIDYEKAFGKTEQEVYDGWKEFLSTNY